MTTAKERSKQWREENRDRYNSYFKEWHRTHPGKRAEYRKRRIEEGRESVKNEISAKRKYKSENRWRQYGLTNEQFHSMLEFQDGRCAICCEEVILDGRANVRPHVDHNHATGIVRGILCGRCNNGLGFFRDDPNLLARAGKYLKGTA